MKKTTKKNKTQNSELRRQKTVATKPCTLNPIPYTLSAASLKLLAFEGKSIAECETLLSEELKVKSEKLNKKKKSKTNHSSLCTINLNEIFEKQPELKAAWERGRFLRALAKYAATATTFAEAEIELKLPAGELDNIFKTDAEAADTWNQARHNKRIEIREAIINKAVDKLTPSALKQIDLLLQKEIVTPSADFARVSINEMCEIAGVTRMTLHTWHTQEGCPRNMGANPTFNLAAVWKWFSEYIIRRASPQKAETPAQSEKARKYKMENDERLGKLLDRNKVIAGLAARNQTIMRIFAKSLAEQKDPYIKQSLERCFEEIRREIATAVPELKLSEEQAARLKELFNELNADCADNADKSEILNPKSETNSNDKNSNTEN
jgi:hypothetical protein